MATKKKKLVEGGPRAYATGIELMVKGFPGSAVVDLVSLVKSESTATAELSNGQRGEFISVCPDCKEPLSTKYLCEPGGHGPFVYDQVLRAVKTKNPDKSTNIDVIGTPEEVKAQSAPDLEDRRCLLTPVRASEVSEILIPSGSQYVLRPSAALLAYAVISSLVADDGFMYGPDGEPRVLVGEMVVNGGVQKPYILDKKHGQLILREVARPERVYAHPKVDISEYETSESFIGMVDKVAEAVMMATEAFDAELFKSRAKSRLVDFVERRIENPDLVNSPREIQVDRNTQAVEDEIARLSALMSS